MYDYIPNRQNQKARVVVLCLALGAVAAFFGSAYLPAYPAILQAIGLALLVPLIQITGRYLVLHYLYRLRERDDGQVDFEVYSYRGGTRMQLICRVGLDEIVATAPLSAENKRPPAKMRRYSYLPDIAPARATVVSVRNQDGDCELLLAPDEHIDGVLAAAAAQYRECHGEESLAARGGSEQE